MSRIEGSLLLLVWLVFRKLSISFHITFSSHWVWHWAVFSSHSSWFELNKFTLFGFSGHSQAWKGLALTKMRVVGLISNSQLLMIWLFHFLPLKWNCKSSLRPGEKKTGNTGRPSKEQERREKDMFLLKGKKYKPNPQNEWFDLNQSCLELRWDSTLDQKV